MGIVLRIFLEESFLLVCLFFVFHFQFSWYLAWKMEQSSMSESSQASLSSMGWSHSNLSHLPSPSYDPRASLVVNPYADVPPPPPLQRQDAMMIFPPGLSSAPKTASEPVDGSSPSTIDSSSLPQPVGCKKRKVTKNASVTSTEAMPPPMAPMKRKRQTKMQLPMLVLPDSLLEKWEIESGTFVIRPRLPMDYAAMRTSATMSDN